MEKKHLLAKRKLVNKRVAKHKRFYKQYFQFQETPGRGLQVAVIEAVKATKRNYGYFALLSNEKMDAMTSLEQYRNNDLIEKAFGNIKDRLNLCRPLESTEKSLDGNFDRKIFVALIALIYWSYLKKTHI